MQRQRSISQLLGRNAGHPDVNGHCLHVEAIAGHAMPMRAEEFVAPGRAVAADDINLEIGIPQRHSQVVQQVEDSGIVLVNFAGAVVSQIAIQACERFRIVAFAVAVDDVQSLPGMCVEKMQAVRTLRNGLYSWLGDSRGYQPAGEDHGQQHKIAQTSYRQRQSKRLPKIDWPPKVAWSHYTKRCSRTIHDASSPPFAE